MNKAIGEQENSGRTEQSSLCTDAPSPQKRIGKRDVCESPSLIVYRYTFAYLIGTLFPLAVENVLTEQHDCGLLLFIDEYVMLWWKISTRTCSISCGFDTGSTVYISSQMFYAGVDPFDDFEKVSRKESFTSLQQELKLYRSPALLLSNFTSRDRHMGHCSQTSQTTSTQCLYIRSLIKL